MLWVFWGVSIYLGVLVRHCGFRTAGEALFFYSQKKYPKKAATTPGAPVESTGVPIEGAQVSCCEKTRKRRSDSFHRKPMRPEYPQWLG